MRLTTKDMDVRSEKPDSTADETRKQSVPWTLIQREFVLDDEWIRISRDRCARADGTQIDKYYVVHGTDWVNICPVTVDGQIVLVREYRHGFGHVLLGLPGGLIDAEDISPVNAALRELREEVGALTVLRMMATGQMIVNPSTHTNTGFSFVALLDSLTPARLRTSEPDIEIVVMPFCEAAASVLDHTARYSGYDAASILRALFKLKANRSTLTPGFRSELGRFTARHFEFDARGVE